MSGKTSKSSKKPIWPLLVFGAAAAVTALSVTAMAAREVLGNEAAVEYFMVRQIVIEGLSRVPEQDVTNILNIQPGSGIFSVDLERAGQELERHPLVSSVEIRRKLPSTLYVKVVERWPSFQLEAGKGNWLLDDSAVAVSPADQAQERTELPLIRVTALEGARVSVGMKVTGGGVTDLVALARRLKGYKLFGEYGFVGLDTLGAQRVTARFAGTSAVVVALRSGWTDEMERLRAMDHILRGKEEGITEIDLSFADKVVVRRQPEAEQNQG
ncbi:MAG: FtsQ-type POTRA domain-containing protein [Nitrospinota bacterium]|nr:FtsQ-type POTRA domain-containing protein [Nitrospinota bacterium]